MRTEKELWQLVLSRQDLFEDGICNWAWSVHENGLMTFHEYDRLMNMLDLNDFNIDKYNFLYWFKPYELQPRIDWINERIKQLENETI